MSWKDWIGPYYSVRFIRVESWKLALFNYSLQFAIFAYIVIYQVVLQKHYQTTEHFVGTISTKVKGVANYIDPKTQKRTVFDIYDAIIPPLEQNAVFLVTNIYSTPQQKRGICPGNGIPHEQCDARKKCIPNKFYPNGIGTGDCDFHSGFCALNTWCPVENQDTRTDSKQLYNIENWSIYIKVVGEFPAYHVQFDNLAPANSTKPLIRYKNLWYVSDILQELNVKYEDIVVNGIIISGKYEFHCNLDISINKCEAQWKWTRLDSTDSASTGFNYRYIHTFRDYLDHVDTRTLNKIYGIRILINVVGTAQKFDLITLVLTIGSGLGLLGVSKVICDLILVWLMPEKSTVQEKKYEPVFQENRSLSDSDILTLNSMINNRPVDIDVSDEKFKTVSERAGWTNENEMSRVALKVQPSSSDMNIPSTSEFFSEDSRCDDEYHSVTSPLMPIYKSDENSIKSQFNHTANKPINNTTYKSVNNSSTKSVTAVNNSHNPVGLSFNKMFGIQSSVERRPSRRSSEERLLT